VRDDLGLRSLDLALDGDVEADGREGRHAAERGALRPPVEEIRDTGAHASGRLRLAVFADEDEPGCVAIRERPKQDAVDGAEHRGVCPDAERHQCDDDGGESGRLAHGAQAVAKVRRQGHAVTSSGRESLGILPACRQDRASGELVSDRRGT